MLAELPALRSLADDLDGRMDLRGKCVFTIDPEGARDLDDALSVTANADGTFDAAVHIADVGHFVRCVPAELVVIAGRLPQKQIDV